MKQMGPYVVIGSALIACGIALSGGIYDMKPSVASEIIIYRINKWNGEIDTCILTKGCKPINQY